MEDKNFITISARVGRVDNQRLVRLANLRGVPKSEILRNLIAKEHDATFNPENESDHLDRVLRAAAESFIDTVGRTTPGNVENVFEQIEKARQT